MRSLAANFSIPPLSTHCISLILSLSICLMSACRDDPSPKTEEQEEEEAVSKTQPVIKMEMGYYQFCGDNGSTGCVRIIPGGTFLMGAQSTSPSKPGYDPHALPNEGPVRRVTLTSYGIQQDPVTARHYGQCIQKRRCSVQDVRHGPGTWNLDREDRLTHPINGVSWMGAHRYCQFVGGRLPTEAEWEFAARGSESFRFPWGNEPHCGRYPQDAGPYMVNIKTPKIPECIHEGTLSVFDTRYIEARGFELRPSPFKLNGMAGNVWEWVEDWYGDDAYQSEITLNPKGPSEGTERVQRGGGWADRDPSDLRSAARGSLPPDMRMDDVGFRCAWDLPEGRGL